MPEHGPPVEFVAIAKSIKVGRTVFDQLYDSVVEPLVPDKAHQFLTLAKLREKTARGLTGRDRGVADFAEALRQASQLNLLVLRFHQFERI